MRGFLLILFAVFLCFGCGTTNSSYQGPPAPLEQHRAQIAQWESQFQAADYPTKLKMLKVATVGQAKAELAVLGGISTTWEQSINSGGIFAYDISKAMAQAKAGGWDTLYAMHFDSLKKAMSQVSNPADQYKKAYEVLLELFSICSQLHSLANSPQGSYVSFNKTVNDLSLELDKNSNNFDVVLPN